MNRVIHFEIHAADPERAARFYRDAFGWDIQEWVIPGVQIANENRYWLVTTGSGPEPGINGGLLFRRGSAPADGQPVNAFVCTLDVSSLDESLERALAAGATLAVPKMPITSVGWLAYCKDTEGNIFGLMQEDKAAG
ncbi:MAG: VOC family protein [Acidobacteria bacterium]|nr:VOC family protein [Acidobacteriota bacterium]MCK6684426.1 VOC family protein [Thermoanaerobaculia bacterium]